MCDGRSPLYAALSRGIADDPATLMLAVPARAGHSPVNLLLAAVQYLLLGGADHPLRAFYPMLGGQRDAMDAYPVFADFCQTLRDQIIGLVATRSVQTNDVGRSALLLPGFCLTWNAFHERPLHLIEVGCSAGLHLLFDRYRYEYVNDDGAVQQCGPDSTVTNRTVVHGSLSLPALEPMPTIAARIGIDVALVNVRDADAVRWVESFIWADDVQRITRFRAAVELTRLDPPRLIAGDGIDMLPDAVRAADASALPCVFHSHATYIMDDDWRRRFHDAITELGRERDLAHLSLEWLGDDPGPKLVLSLHRSGVIEQMHLADCQQHGHWLRWFGKR